MHNIDKVSHELACGRMVAAKWRPYYNTAIYRLIPIETTQVQTLAVDPHWRLYYNQSYVKSLEPVQVASCVIHEIEHLLRKHHERSRKGNFEHDLFNIAGDFEINGTISHDPLISLPTNCLFPQNFKLDDGLLAEEYYRIIEEAKKQVKLPCSCGSGAHGKKEEHDLPGKDKGGPRDVSEIDAEMVRRKVAKDMTDYDKLHPGRIPDGSLRWAKGVLSPKVPWQSALKATVKGLYAKCAGLSDTTYSRLNRRQVHNGRSRTPSIILPAYIDRLPNIVIVIDTSGSMGEVQLLQALAEVKGIIDSLGAREGVTIMSVDAAVNSTQKVFHHSAVKLFGGGGTDMGLGVAEAGKLKTKPDFIVVLTDGYTGWPAENPAPGIKTIVARLVSESQDAYPVPNWVHKEILAV